MKHLKDDMSDYIEFSLAVVRGLFREAGSNRENVVAVESCNWSLNTFHTSLPPPPQHSFKTKHKQGLERGGWGKMWSLLAAQICHFLLTARNPDFCDKKCRILPFRDEALACILALIVYSQGP